jgi:hypothetical protein
MSKHERRFEGAKHLDSGSVAAYTKSSSYLTPNNITWTTMILNGNNLVTSHAIMSYQQVMVDNICPRLSDSQVFCLTKQQNQNTSKSAIFTPMTRAETTIDQLTKYLDWYCLASVLSGFAKDISFHPRFHINLEQKQWKGSPCSHSCWCHSRCCIHLIDKHMHSSVTGACLLEHVLEPPLGAVQTILVCMQIHSL